MNALTTDLFRQLAEIHEGRCLSIYMPTHRAGQEVLRRQDHLVLKNVQKEVAKVLESRGYDRVSIADFLLPIKIMIEDLDFWKYRSEGLAILLAPGQKYVFDLPKPVGPFHVLAHEYYLRPLIPMLENQPHYHFLSLQLHQVKLYEGKGSTLSEVSIPHLPQQMEEVVGVDFEESSLSFHRQKMGGNPYTVYHGKGEWQEDHKSEILAFCRSIDDAILSFLEQDGLPLFMATTPELFSIYKEANHYRNLYPEPINRDGLPSSLAPVRQEIERALSVDFKRKMAKKAGLIRQFQSTDRVSTSWNELVQGAVSGRVEALFLEADRETWGVFEKSKGEVRIHAESNLGNTSLMNLAAIQVFLQGGEVFEAPLNEMPLPGYQANALFRY